MSREALRLLRVERTVGDLRRSAEFYTGALGFSAEFEQQAPPHLAHLLGADQIRQITLHRGGNTLVLQSFAPPGGQGPFLPVSCNQSFQHIALPVRDMDLAVNQLRPFAPELISRGGPQHLPPSSGDVIALKFRDPDGSPLELIRFPVGISSGIDHSALVTADVERSLRYYRDTLGLRVAARQTNRGQRQDSLDGLDGVVVEVVALAPAEPSPHIELLGYRTPPVRLAAASRPAEQGSTRLVLEVSGLTGPEFVYDPDGHGLLLLPAR